MIRTRTIRGFFLSTLFFTTIISGSANAYDETHLRQARLLSARLTGGIPLPVGADLDQVATLISNGQYAQAAQFVIDHPSGYFYTYGLRKYFSPYQTPAKSERDIALNDMMALQIVMVRDDKHIGDMWSVNAQGLVRDANGAAGTGYTAADQRRANLKDDLVFSMNQPKTGAESAGIMTSEKFAAEFWRDGTNRRFIYPLVDVAMCPLTINSLRSSEPSDQYVGRDVERNPIDLYLGQCKTCHGGASMDSMRGAFAYLDFNGGNGLQYTPGTVRPKYSRASNNYPDGYTTRDNSWSVNWTPAQSSLIGWEGMRQGFGARTFGEAWGKSTQVYRCFVSRVVKAVCPGADDPYTYLPNELHETLARRLKADGNLKSVFVDVSTHPTCLARKQ